MPAAPGQQFRFAIDPAYRWAARLLRLTDASAHVEVGPRDLTIRFGLWSLATPLGNVADAELTGPYAWWRALGPPRLSLADRGVTFATSTRQGVCVTFVEPVGGVLPVPGLRHPGATVTVEDTAGLIAALRSASGRRDGSGG
jgi:hypothetical protein